MKRIFILSILLAMIVYNECGGTLEISECLKMNGMPTVDESICEDAPTFDDTKKNVFSKIINV